MTAKLAPIVNPTAQEVLQAAAEFRRHAQRPAVIQFAAPAPDDAASIAAGLALTGDLVIGYVRKLEAMSARSKLSNGALVATATSYPDPKVQDAAVALFQARTGQLAGQSEFSFDLPATVEFLEALAE